MQRSQARNQISDSSQSTGHNKTETNQNSTCTCQRLEMTSLVAWQKLAG